MRMICRKLCSCVGRSISKLIRPSRRFWSWIARAASTMRLRYSRVTAGRRRTLFLPIATARLRITLPDSCRTIPPGDATSIRRTICAHAFPSLPFAQLPRQAPTRNAILVSANNKTYGDAYPYRLSAQFEPPYRAYRIAELLRMRSRYDAAYFARMQLDTLSPIDLEIARDVVRFARLHSTQGWPNAAALASAGPMGRALRTEFAGRGARTRGSPRGLEDGTAFNAHLDALRDQECEECRRRPRLDALILRVRRLAGVAKRGRHARRTSPCTAELRVSQRRVASRLPATSTRFTCKSRRSRRASARYGMSATGIEAASRFRAASRANPVRGTTRI